jgi:YidC/Oxa1 family membrane protein insertase
MNDIRRTILWVIFGFSMVMLWDQWQVASGNKPTFFPSPPKAGSVAAPGLAAASAAKGLDSVPAASTSAAAASAAAGPATAPAGGVSVAQSSARAPVVVSTDVLKLSFDTEGGALIRAELLQHRDLVDNKSNMVLLDLSKDRVYLAQTGFVGGSGLPNHKTPMTLASSEKTLADGANTLQVRFESDEVGGAKLVKTYTLKRGAYDIAVTHELRNTGSAPLTAQLYLQLVRDGNKPAGESSFYQTFTGPVVYSAEKKYQKIDFSDIEKGKADHVKQTADGYVGMAQHYFASAWLQPSGTRDIFTRKLDANMYAVGTVGALQTIAPGASQTLTSTLFVGPQEENKLEALYPGLELLKDYGWFTIFSKPLFWLLDKLFGLIGNWGWAIVALVVLLKIAFYWLNAKAYSSMAKMKAINPKVMEMRERLKDKPQQMQQEMMKIYREEKVNPMGGCFPIMIQIPVFIALYWVLLSTVEMRDAPWILWIKDLSAPDPFFILPIVMTGTTLLQTWLNPTPPDPMQAKLMWIMPLIFSVMFLFFPAGLVLYWLTNNILSIAQQWVINKRLGVLGK